MPRTNAIKNDAKIQKLRNQVLDAQFSTKRERIYSIIEVDGELELCIRDVAKVSSSEMSEGYDTYINEVAAEVDALNAQGHSARIVEYGHTHPLKMLNGREGSSLWNDTDKKAIRGVFDNQGAKATTFQQAIIRQGSAFIIQAASPVSIVQPYSYNIYGTLFGAPL